MHTTKVISLGGSIVAPEGPDIPFLKKLKTFLEDWLREEAGRRLILIIGGGGPARLYQQAYREVTEGQETGRDNSAQAQDWIGIRATRLNAELVKGIFGGLCRDEIVTDPHQSESFSGRILVGAGWKPGFSTDFDAVLLAEKYKADTVINLSNIAQVYTDDPKTNPDARPLERVSWDEFKGIVGDEWIPGRNLPFDPVATKRAAELGLKVICSAGRDIGNTRSVLNGEAFHGTQIGPE